MVLMGAGHTRIRAQLPRALHKCLAAHSVEIGVIPIEFGRSGDTQALPKA